MIQIWTKRRIPNAVTAWFLCKSGFSPKCLDWMVAVFQECVELCEFNSASQQQLVEVFEYFMGWYFSVYLSRCLFCWMCCRVLQFAAMHSLSWDYLNRSWKSTLPSTKWSIGTDHPNVCCLVQFEFWSVFWRKWPAVRQTGWWLQGGGHSLARWPVSRLCAWAYVFVSHWKVEVLWWDGRWKCWSD